LVCIHTAKLIDPEEGFGSRLLTGNGPWPTQALQTLSEKMQVGLRQHFA